MEKKILKNHLIERRQLTNGEVRKVSNTGFFATLVVLILIYSNLKQKER